VLAQIAAQEKEKEEVKTKGAEAISEDSQVLRELLKHLIQHGGRTIERLTRELNFENKEITKAYVRKAEELGLVSTAVGKRGSTIATWIGGAKRRNPSQNSWYRNAGRTVYHRAADNWIRRGKAVCGAKISRPGFVARDTAEIKRAGKRPCKRCKGKLRRRR
jgi:hypothetical protein